MPQDASRRSFLGTAGALGAGLAVGAPGPAAAAGGPGAAVPGTENAESPHPKEPRMTPHSPVPGPEPEGAAALDALALSRAIRRREVSCAEVMTAYLDHVERANPRVNALVGLRDRESSMAEAEERDRQLARGEYLGWMHGLPHAVKDLAAAEGLPWTEGSPLYKDRIADHDDLHVRRIKAAGAIVIGKTNAPEWGLGSQTYNPVWGTTGNAYDPERTAGGSSGGAACALATRMLPVADGSDYMGSLRNPAAFNNVYGLRPTWGRVPAPGFVAQLGVAGPMARTVPELAALLGVMAGPDAGSPLGLPDDPRLGERPERRDFSGTRIAWAGDWNGRLPMEPGVLDVCERSFGPLRALGCEIEEALPDFSLDEIWQTFLTWRWWDNLSLNALYEDPAKRRRLKPEAVWEVEHGRELGALDVQRAVEARDRYYASVLQLLDTYDFVLAPSAQVFPFDKAVHWPGEIAGRAMDTYHRWMETVAPWSLTGLPSLAMPAGFDARGLPMGVQVITRHAGERDLLQLALAYETAR
ncbi:amidase [Streptomyces sp. ODS28]|uniref:amidase n=1 Tax=Streptomyces sp. ODS28 TaxID=3136688 RepID=UPI0031EECCFA